MALKKKSVAPPFPRPTRSFPVDLTYLAPGKRAVAEQNGQLQETRGTKTLGLAAGNKLWPLLSPREEKAYILSNNHNTAQ